MKHLLGSAILAAGIALAGYFIYCGVDNIAHKDRFVTVKGLSERQVMADKVTWTLSFSRQGEDLQSCYRAIGPDKERIIRFLKDHGIQEDEIFPSVPSSDDRSTWYNWHEMKGSTPRYAVSQNIVVVTSDVQRIIDLRSDYLAFVDAGIVADISMCSYDYTGLNDLKPAMVEEATCKARLVANKFAEDAQCTLGSIRTARQGQFEIESDDVMPHLRHVRVVTTIDYYLK